MDDIAQLSFQVRELVNRTRRISILHDDFNTWLTICSAMDVLGDTSLATSSYGSLAKKSKSDGASYLIIYGILQVLFVQQDAARTIADTLSVQLDTPTELLSIREIRNLSVGHPTRVGRKYPFKQGFITRYSMTPLGFELRITSDSTQEQSRFVDISRLIEIQQIHVCSILQRVIAKLENDELTHRSRFRDKKLINCFDPLLSHGFEKIGEALRDPRFYPLGTYGTGLIQKSVSDFKKSLEERNESVDPSDAVGYLMSQVEYPLAQLNRLFEHQTTHINTDDGLIFKEFIELKIRELREIAQQIDEDYASDQV